MVDAETSFRCVCRAAVNDARRIRPMLVTFEMYHKTINIQHVSIGIKRQRSGSPPPLPWSTSRGAARVERRRTESTRTDVRGAARLVAGPVAAMPDAQPSVVCWGGAAVMHAQSVRAVLVAESSGFHFC